MAERSLAKRLWYGLVQVSARLGGVYFYRIRVRNRHLVPATGGALVMSNHQSNFDPVLAGLACDRRLNFLARQTLFQSPLFAWLINSLDAIPLDREGSGLGGLKETLRRLKRGEMVLMFPEGTRCADGQVAPLKPGFCAVARRAGVPLVIMAIDGAFDAWPRTRRYPAAGIIQIEFGAPLLPAEIEPLDDAQLLAEVESRLRSCHGRAARYRQLAGCRP